MSTQSLWATNALWAAAAIQARLADQVPELVEVLVLDDVDPEKFDTNRKPAAVVLLGRMRPVSEGQRAVAIVIQDWVVALMVRNAGTELARNSAEAGPLIPAVVRALQGWVPPGQHRALEWQPGTRPTYGRNATYWPLVFSLQVVTA